MSVPRRFDLVGGLSQSKGFRQVAEVKVADVKYVLLTYRMRSICTHM